MSFVSDMLAAISERGRALVDFTTISQAATPVEQIGALSRRLLSSRGEASALATASEITQRYERLDADAKLEFFRMLLIDFGPMTEPLLAAARAYAAAPDQKQAEALHTLSEPRRQNLFRLLNQTANGTAHLIQMRADLLRCLRDNPELELVDKDFQHLFRSWFNRGFLELRRIDWHTSAVVLERIIHHEAVHEIADWKDLRGRIDPPDRRLYAFFHPRLRDEPLIFVEVALAADMISSIGSILDPAREVIAGAASTAVFYSISDCQPGLKGISFGNFLIKQVVEELRSELPHVSRFVTLSPVPLFARWLAGQPVARALGLDVALATPEWWLDPKAAALDQPLTALAAWYLTGVQDGSGRLYDPVARFHLGNGARLERVNWLANKGPNGMASSHGIMVNYLYKLGEIERNHETYASGQAVAASGAVRRAANAGARLMDQSVADETGDK